MVYYVEDDPSIRELVVYTLEQSGIEAQGFETGTEFLSACQAKLPEVVLLDIMLPDEDGLALLRRLKGTPRTAKVPVIMLTAKGTEYDKVIGLDTGADDYLAKPFGMMEMVARVRARLRAASPQTQNVFEIGGVTLDVPRHMVFIGTERVELTLKEFEVLQFLMENHGLIFTREHLLERVWGADYEGGTRTVDVHVQTLRQKLGAYGGQIQTLRGVGYRFEAENER